MRRRALPRQVHFRGVSMVEAVVVIGMSALLLGLGVTTIHLLLEAQRATATELSHNGALTRVAAQFRSDVHAARSTEQPDASQLDLQFDAERTVTYRIADQKLARVASQRGTIEQRDEFHLPAHTRVDFSADPERFSVALRLAIPTNTDRSSATSSKGLGAPRSMSVVAVIGRDHRFEGTDE